MSRKTKPSPKPVRAWALSMGDATILAAAFGNGRIGIVASRKDGMPVTEEGLKADGFTPVLIVPADSPEARAVEEVRRLRRALEFYANENAYVYQGDIHLAGSVIVDRGAIAASTLAGNDPMGDAERALRKARRKDAALRRGGKK